MIPHGARVHYPGCPDDQGTAEHDHTNRSPTLVVVWDDEYTDQGPPGDLSGRIEGHWGDDDELMKVVLVPGQEQP